MKLFPVATKHGYLTLLGVRLAADGSVRFVFVDVTPCVCVCVCVWSKSTSVPEECTSFIFTVEKWPIS